MNNAQGTFYCTNKYFFEGLATGFFGNKRKKSKGTREHERISENEGNNNNRELRAGEDDKQICKREQISKNCGNMGTRTSPPPGRPSSFFASYHIPCYNIDCLLFSSVFLDSTISGNCRSHLIYRMKRARKREFFCCF